MAKNRAFDGKIESLWRVHNRSIRRLVIRGQLVKMRAEYLLRKNKPHQALIVIGSARCGSNLLVQLLDSHPQITMKNEVLSPWTITGLGAEYEDVSQTQAVRHLIRCIQHTKTEVSGVKLLQRQAKYFWLTPQVLSQKLPNAYFVLCYRRSLLEQYVSGLLADQTGAWVSGERARVENPKVHVHLDAFRTYCEAVQSANSELVEKDLPGLRWTPIAYEELCANPTQILEERVTRPLSLPPHAPMTFLKKQNTRPLAEVIENFSELEKVVRAPWAMQDYSAAIQTS